LIKSVNDVYRKKPGTSVNHGSQLNQTTLIQGRDSSANISVLNATQQNASAIQNVKIPRRKQ